MVKHLRHISTIAKLFVLGILLIFIWGAIWLQSAEHSLEFAKPWILRTLNPADAPYTVSLEQVKIDWRNLTKFGKLRMTDITLSDKEGAVFARLPSVYASIDPLGFLPQRTLLRRVILIEPHLAMTRNADGVVRIGLEGEESSIALNTLFASDTPATGKPIRLPFRYFMIDHASIKFHDEVTGEDIISEDMSLRFGRRGGHYQGALMMPFRYKERSGSISGVLGPNEGRDDYLAEVTLESVPAEWICSFGPCPEKTDAAGALNGTIRLGITEKAELGAAWAHVSTDKTVLSAPAWFAQPVVLGKGTELTAGYNAEKGVATLEKAVLSLEDTTVSAAGVATHKEDGWHLEATGEAGRLDVTKISKYWPLFLAPETRLWVTSKMKAGHATGKVKLHATPQDMAAEDLPDHAIDADVVARDVTVDYLQGFPYIEHLDGDIHFTGTTVKIDGRNGSMLTGTKITKAYLLCPDLLNPRNPMEVTLDAHMPMADAATLLTLKHFSFDDALGLDAKKATGQFSANIALKFDAFSENTNPDPNYVNFDAVSYDIKGRIENFAQSQLMGGYDVKALSGDFAAGMHAASFTGSLMLGDTGVSQVAVTNTSGKPTSITVKSAGEPGKANNDFALLYNTQKGVPNVAVSGKRLDASVTYGGGKNNLLKDFPAINLTVDLGELILAPALPFTQVKGTLNCSKIRCESAHFTTLRGKARVKADITRNGSRQFVLSASDAGDFLKGLDITDRVTGGKLELRGTYDDAKTPIPFNGKLAIGEFTLKNSQILGRILSIGSLTGLANALTGSGISFNKLTADIQQRAGVVTVSEGRANGTAMGITLGGTVDTNTTKLDLKGVVVPAYMLNSFLGNIPIIGALAGGEGEGLIAFNYSVRGTYVEPEVMVNPLSGLTPGFLRGIFGIFDKPAEKPKDDADAPEAKEQKPGESRVTGH